MLTVLIANQNVEENTIINNLFSDKNTFNTFQTYTGIDTLNKYRKNEPNISIIDTDFTDISSNVLIDKLSESYPYIYKCNFILTTEQDTDINEFNNFKRIYQVFRKPFQYDELKKSVYELKPQYEIANISDFDINVSLIEFRFNISSDSTKYMRMAISICYYQYPNFPSLKELYFQIAEYYGKTVNEVKAGIRNSLSSVNNSRLYLNKKTILDIYNNRKKQSGNVGSFKRL